jgi:hypothetical protein
MRVGCHGLPYFWANILKWEVLAFTTEIIPVAHFVWSMSGWLCFLRAVDWPAPILDKRVTLEKEKTLTLQGKSIKYTSK